MTCVAVLQPSYLPWLGYFEQIALADVFVLYDTVQFDKHGWRNRNRIKTPQGPQWLTVPVLTHGRGDEPIRAVPIDRRYPWARKHLAAMRTYYGRAPYFKPIFAALEELLSRDWQGIAELNVALIRWFAAYLGLDTRLVLASSLDVQGDKNERLVQICRHFGADRYFSAAASRCYLDSEQFSRAGIEVNFQDYRHPVYRQLHGDFLPYLSVVDLLFNEGPASRSILLGTEAAVTA